MSLPTLHTSKHEHPSPGWRYALPLVVSALLFNSAHAALAADQPITVTSPDGQIHITLKIKESANGQATPAYEVSFRDQQIVSESSLGLNLRDGGPLQDLQFVSTRSDSKDETYPLLTGKCSSAGITTTKPLYRLRKKAALDERWRSSCGRLMTAWHFAIACRNKPESKTSY